MHRIKATYVYVSGAGYPLRKLGRMPHYISSLEHLLSILVKSLLYSKKYSRLDKVFDLIFSVIPKYIFRIPIFH